MTDVQYVTNEDERVPLAFVLSRDPLGVSTHRYLRDQGIFHLEDAALCYKRQIEAIPSMSEWSLVLLEQVLRRAGLTFCPEGESQQVRAAWLYGHVTGIPWRMLIFISRRDINRLE